MTYIWNILIHKMRLNLEVRNLIKTIQVFHKGIHRLDLLHIYKISTFYFRNNFSLPVNYR